MEEKEEKQEIIRLRNHITYIVEKIWYVLVLIVYSFLDGIEEAFGLLRQGGTTQGLQILGGILGILLLVFLWNLNRWYRTTLTIQDGTVTSTKATLNRRTNTMSITNISNINLEQNLFERLVGTCKVRLDTNSLTTANTTDLEIILKKRDAEQLEQMLLAVLREQQGEEALQQLSGQSAIGEGEDVVAYSKGEALRNSLITTSVMEYAILLVLLASFVISVLGFYEAGESILAILGTLLLQAFVIFVFQFNILKKWLQFMNFRARREGDKIYVESGLLKKKNYVVPVDKINAVTLRYTLIGRICRRGFVKVINVGGEGEEADGVQLLFAESRSELRRKLHLLLPECTFPEEGMVKPPGSSYCKLSVLYGLLALIWIEFFFGGVLWLILGRDQIVLPCCIAGVICVAVTGLARLLRYHTTGLLYREEDFVISRGTFAKEVQIIAYDKIQYIHLEQGPVQRRLKLQRGNICILAGVLSQVQKIGTFSNAVFEELEERLKKTY